LEGKRGRAKTRERATPLVHADVGVPGKHEDTKPVEKKSRRGRGGGGGGS